MYPLYQSILNIVFSNSINCKEGQTTVAQRLGERHTTDDIVQFLKSFHRQGAPAPKEFICDGSRALLNAAVHTYSRHSNIEEYANSIELNLSEIT